MNVHIFLLCLFCFVSNEEDDDSLTKMESESLFQEFDEDETRITTVIAQAEGMERKNNEYGYR